MDTGGSVIEQPRTSFFRDRSSSSTEVIALAPPQEIKVRMQAPPERKFSTWMGGSVLASLSSFKNLWVTMEEYEEKGAAIIHRKML